MKSSRIKSVLMVLLISSVWLPMDVRPQKAKDVPVLSKAQWKEDLQYFARELPKRHKNLFHTVSRAEFDRMVAELDAAIPTLADHQIIVRMLQITAKVGDGHTYVHLPDTFKRYPLALYWFGNELRVTRTTQEYKDALGARVVKVNGIDMSEVQKRMLTVLSQAENEWYILSNGPGYMVRPEVLQTLGVVADLDHAAFTFETDEGTQITMDVATVPASPSFLSTTIGAAKAEPLNRLYPTEPFRFTYLPESQAVYVNFRTYESLEDNIKKLFQLIDANPVKKLVIDFRQNGGGDFFKGRRLVSEIKQHPAINQKGSLFVIIGRRTFSAAMVNSLDFRKETNAILVGEPIGELPNSYSENNEIKLPNSGIVVSYSTRYYKFVDGENVVLPDKRIDPTWADYKTGRDVVLDWILFGDKKPA